MDLNEKHPWNEIRGEWTTGCQVHDEQNKIPLKCYLSVNNWVAKVVSHVGLVAYDVKATKGEESGWILQQTQRWLKAEQTINLLKKAHPIKIPLKQSH